MLDHFPNITGLPFDMRAEVLAMFLAEEYGLSTEQVLCNPAYWHQRPGRRDVVDLTEDFSHRLEKKLLCIETSREGLFDILPETLFLNAEELEGGPLRRIQALSEQEARARQFLLPFEQLFFWMRLENETREWTLGENLHEWWSGRFLTRETEDLEDRRRAVLLEMLPYAHEITGNWQLTAQWLELFTGHKVRITEEDFPLFDLPESLQKRLGSAVLGQDLVLGRTFTDGIPAVKVVFENLAPGEVAGLLPGGEEHAFLEEHFAQYLLPVETPCSIGVESKATGTPFELNPDNEANVLGYTTHL